MNATAHIFIRVTEFEATSIMPVLWIVVIVNS